MAAYLLSFYEIDRAYGGPEEGGWWYDCGTHVRTFAVYHDKQKAYEMAYKANRILSRLQKNKRPVGSVIYGGGRHSVIVHKNRAPEFFPEKRPHYE